MTIYEIYLIYPYFIMRM